MDQEMARTARKAESLADDEGMGEAMAVVLERAEAQGTVEWADVRTDLTSGQWGRLIQTGILVDAGSAEGFVIDDPEAVREAIDEDVGRGSSGGSSDGSAASAGSPSTPSSDAEGAADDADDEETTWTTYDKAAAIGAVGMFAGYLYTPVRNIIGGGMDLLFGPLETFLPFYMVVLVLAMFTGLYSTLLQANLMNMDKMGEYQQRMQDIQARRKDAKERGDDEEVQAIQEEQMSAMGDQLGMFKEQFRPMVWIMLLTVPVFLWMYWKIGARGGISHGLENAVIVLPLVGEVGWTAAVVGPMQAWIVWYFLCSMGFTQIIRKALDIQTTPT
jgi:uncharacterized membrane protein (DUF106 family)